MKAQASLEMVVGLIILLVVAAVVISLVLFYITPERMPSPSEAMEVNQFKNDCEIYCSSIESSEYCKYYFKGSDWNGNGMKNELIKVGKYEWDTCEERIYCFLVVPCEDRFGSGADTIKNCKQFLCQTYLEKYDNDPAEATRALDDAISLEALNRCGFSDEVEGLDNWYDLEEEDSFADGCGGVGPGPTIPPP